MPEKGNLHEDLSARQALRGASNRVFGFVFTILFGILALLPLRRQEPPRWWAVALSAAFLLAAVIAPRSLAPLNKLWIKIAELLNRITNPLVMGLIFYGVITPIGILMRWRGKDPLLLAPGSNDSYWIHRKEEGPTTESMINQF